MNSTLSDLIKIAIAKNDGQKLAAYIEVCDSLHSGIPAQGFGVEDIPTDALYEEAKARLELIKSRISSSLITPRVTRTKTSTKQISDLHMAQDAIIKNSRVLLKDTHILCMPKYDGVSCAIRFIYNEKSKRFDVDAATTRGKDVALSHKNTDMTERIKPILYSTTCPWFKSRFHKLGAKYKSITVRGEIVLITRTIPRAAPYVAGRVNSHLEVIDAEHVMGFKMFEITRMIDYEDIQRVPTQRQACHLITQIDTSIPVVEMDLTDDEEANNEQMYELYNKWNEELSSPIDGVVYTTEDWKYPLFAHETHGVSYGKYAMKPNVDTQTTFTGIEYTMSMDGKLNPSFTFEAFEVDGKRYPRAPVRCINNLIDFIENKHLHIGSTITVTLQGLISAQVSDVVDEPAPANTLIQLPTTCPYCKRKLTLTRGKISTLKCTNIECPAIMVKKITNMLKCLHFTGYSDKTVMKLIEQAKGDYNRVLPLMETKVNVKEHLMQTSVGDLIIALGLATRTTLARISSINPIRMNPIRDELAKVREYLMNTPTGSQILIGMILAYI